MNGQHQSSFPSLAQMASSQKSLSSSANSDLEILERLKREILEGQNPYYKAVPQPAFLEHLYLGRSSQGRQNVPAHPEQVTAKSGTTGPTEPSGRPQAQPQALSNGNEKGRPGAAASHESAQPGNKVNDPLSIETVAKNSVTAFYSSPSSDVDNCI